MRAARVLLGLLAVTQRTHAALPEPALRPAEADSPNRESPAPTRVLLVVIGGEAKLSALRAALGPHALRGAQIRWLAATRVRERELLEVSQEGAAARCFVDLSEMPKARLYFADAQAQRFLVRELNLARGLDELGKEALVQVIESSVDTLLADQATAINREQLRSLLSPERTAAAAPSDAAPARGRDPSSDFSAGWGAFYGLRAISAGSVSHGPASWLRFEAPFSGARLSAWASGQYLLPAELSQSVVGVRLTTFALRVGVGVGRSLGASFQFGARLGFGSDVERLTPQETGRSQLSLTPARWVHAELATGALDASLRISRLLWLTASVLADADFRPRHYDLETAGVARVVLEPWPVRPGAMLGATGMF